MKLPSNNLNYPIRINVGVSSGSGFLIKHDSDVYLVTAKHVLFKGEPNTNTSTLIANEARLTCYPRIETGVATIPRIYRLDLEALTLSGDLKVHTLKDLVVVKIGSIVVVDDNQQLIFLGSVTVVQESAGGLVHYDISTSRRFADVDITNEVFVLGYPISLSTPEMGHIDYNAPLARKGIVAGKNNQTQTIVLDCPVYGGNSGGLVLEINDANIHLIGIVVQFVPFVEQWQNTRFPVLQNTSFQNSGYSVALPVDNIFDLIERIEEDN